MNKKKPNFQLIQEGTTKLYACPSKQSVKGPGIKDNEPFYNPAMELNRDLSVVVSQWFVNRSKKQVHIVDGLAASGIRGVRIAHEVTGDFLVTINDWDDDSFSLIKKNIAHNKLTNAVASKKNLNVLLSENKYQMIDIDPFGSPVYFVDSACRSITNNGVLSCTATDTAALCGVYPKVCFRRYGAQPAHSYYMHEIGLRILLGFLAREMAKYDKGIQPLVSYSTDHYFRVYVQIRNGKQNADESMQHVRLFDATDPIVSDGKNNNSRPIGPLWMGNLHKKTAVQELRTLLFEKQVNTKHALWKLLQLFEDEADAPPFFFTMEDIASRLKIGAPPMKTLFRKLQEHKYIAVRTHFSATGFKTNAPSHELEKIFKTITMKKQ